MTFIKEHYKIFIIMASFWILLTMDFTLFNLLIGLAVSFFVSLASKRVLFEEDQSLFKGIKGYKLVPYLFKLFIEIFKSAFQYVHNVISRHYQVVVFEMKLNTDDPVVVGIIANSITLTPGTITIETDGFTITVMQLAKPGITQAELEQPIRDNFEKYLK